MGDDGLVKLMAHEFYKFNILKMSEDARKYFNAHLHPDKTTLSLPNEGCEFLGYKFKGFYLHVDRDTLFRKAVFAENWLTTPEVKAGRMRNYYMLGGSNDDWFE